MRALCAVTPLSVQTRNTTRAAALRVNRRGARQVEGPAFGSTKFKYSEGQERETSSLCTLAPVTELPTASHRFYSAAEAKGSAPERFSGPSRRPLLCSGAGGR